MIIHTNLKNISQTEISHSLDINHINGLSFIEGEMSINKFRLLDLEPYINYFSPFMDFNDSIDYKRSAFDILLNVGDLETLYPIEDALASLQFESVKAGRNAIINHDDNWSLVLNASNFLDTIIKLQSNEYYIGWIGALTLVVGIKS